MQAAERSVRGFAGPTTTRISIFRIAGERSFHVANPPASVAGPPVAVRLYTAPVPMVIDASPGSSRALRVGSTPTPAILADTPLDGQRKLAERGVTLWRAGLNPGLLEVVRHAGLDRQPDADRLLFNARAATARHQALRSTGLAAVAG